MKFGLISNILPPSDTAHAAIIYRLLSHLPPESYCLLSSRNYDDVEQPNYSGRLAGKYYYLPPQFQLTRGYRFGLKTVRETFNATAGILARARTIAQILKRERCEAVVVCTGGNEILDFPAGYLASRMVGARFYAYLLDQYAHMVSYVLGNSPLRRVEPLIIRGAAGVVVPNEFLKEEVRNRYGVEAVVIHNACDLSQYEKSNDDGRANSNARSAIETGIVYTGGIGTLHFDPFKNLMAAIQSLDGLNVAVHLYSMQQPADIERYGIHGRVVCHDYVQVAAMPAIQQQADILFLPLSFEMRYHEIVRTAAPGKMGEYLAARRPILVHAPADSFIANYFREHECGVVVDQNDPAELARAIGSLIANADLRRELARRAGERAEADFDVKKARKQFTEIISGNGAELAST